MKWFLPDEYLTEAEKFRRYDFFLGFLVGVGFGVGLAIGLY